MFKKEDIVNYIEAGHRPDGGYSHTTEGPSSGLETYLGTTALRVLAVKPRDPASLERFWADHSQAGHITEVVGLYLAVGTLRELGASTESYLKYQQIPLDFLKNKEMKDVTKSNELLHLTDPNVDSLYLDVVEGELKYWYYVASILHDLGVAYETKQVIDQVLSLLNPDGGFGRMHGSSIANTYYALKTLTLLKHPLTVLPKTTQEYVEGQLRKSNYLEELHWAVGCHHSLGLAYDPEGVEVPFASSFVQQCQRPGGGFSGSTNMSKSTIEFTYYATTILNTLHKTIPQWA